MHTLLKWQQQPGKGRRLQQRTFFLHAALEHRHSAHCARPAARWLVIVIGMVLLAPRLLWAQMPAQPSPEDAYTPHPRVIIISDIGNEPDDQMSLIRLLLYSNELDIQALIAATSTWQKTVIHPETMHRLVAAYAQVRPSLLRNASGWPTEAYLDQHIFAGQPGYGMAATGPQNVSAGAQAILTAAEQGDPRPLWICLWGGANTLAEALQQARTTRTPAQLQALIARLRVYSISDQDDAGPWIRRQFPKLFYIVTPSNPDGGSYGYATWTGISGDVYYRNGEGADMRVVTNEWLDAHIRNQGTMGKLYPRFAFIMEGDTPSFLNLIDNGLDASMRPDFGGWGGRYLLREPYGETHPIWTQGGDLFTRITSQDTVLGIDGKLHTSDQATIWRWRDAFQNDFAARMHWTVADFKHSNHNPIVVVDGHTGTAPVELDATVGRPLRMDASGTRDPDGQALHYHWFAYQEAGAAGGTVSTVKVADADTPQATVTPTAVCHANWLPLIPCHGTGRADVILAVTDTGSPTLTSYRRVIVTVHPATR